MCFFLFLFEQQGERVLIGDEENSTPLRKMLL
jgi:hypothetical protein